MKRPKWLGDSRATRADKQKKVRRQTDQRIRHQAAQMSGESKVTRDSPDARMLMSSEDPIAGPAKARCALRSRGSPRDDVHPRGQLSWQPSIVPAVPGRLRF